MISQNDNLGDAPAGWILPEPWSNRRAALFCFSGINPPRDTHQSRLRIFRAGGRRYIGKRKASRETVGLLNSLTKAILAARKSEAYAPALAAIKAGPVRLCVYLFYPWPKATPKARRNETDYKVTRPDADNLVKTIQDGLTTRGLFADDSQVTVLEARKYHSPTPGVLILIEPLSL